MQKVDWVAELKERIRLKETEQRVEEAVVREQFHLTYESLKPLNLLRNAIRQVTSSPDVKGNLANAALGIASGFIVKKVVEFGSRNPLLKIIGTILEMVVAGSVTKNADEIKSVAASIFEKFMKQQTTTTPDKTE